MRFLLILLSLAFASIINGDVNCLLSEARTNNALFNYILQSASCMTNPCVTTECFGRFLPVLSEIADRFSHQYQECLMIANNLTNTLTMQAEQSRNVLTTKISQMCEAYQCCEQEKDILDFFNCYLSASSINLNVISNVSHQTCCAANSYNKGLQIIQEECEKCTNNSEKAYITKSAETYKLLDECLQQGNEEMNRGTPPPCEEKTECPAVNYKQPENFMSFPMNEDSSSTAQSFIDDSDVIEITTLAPKDRVQVGRDFRGFTNYKTKDPALEFMIRSMFPKRLKFRRRLSTENVNDK